MGQLTKKLAMGAAWMLGFKLTERSLGIISTIILARLLVPSDFGLVAMGMSIVAILELLGAFSFDMALIQNQSAEKRHYDTAWTFNVLLGVVSALVLIALAKPAAVFYEEPRLHAMMYVLACVAAAGGLENIGVVAFRKELNFKKEFQFLLGKKIAAFAVTIPLAFILRNYWALVVGILVGKVVGVALSFWVHPYRPGLSLAAWQQLVHFSKWLLVNNILGFLNYRAVDLIIGKFTGPRALGLYTLAYEISNLPTTELVAPINRAIFPGYSKMASDVSRLRDGFLKVIGMIALIALPTAMGLAATAELIVPVVFGSKWLNTIPIVQILAFFGAITSLQSNSGYVFLALGKPRILSVLLTILVTIRLPVLIFLTWKAGAVGAAWAMLGTALLMFPAYYITLARQLKLTFGLLLAKVWRPVAASSLMFFSVQQIVVNLNAAMSFSEQLTQAISVVFAGAIIYITVVLLLWLASSKPKSVEYDALIGTAQIASRLPLLRHTKLFM